LDKKGAVKILDMGLARIVGAEAAMGGPERLTTSGQVMGTCDYMAPEQAMDSHMVDARADIYALGCTLYRLLTGNPPYRGDSLMQILMAHQQAPIPSICQTRAEVPAELDAVFQKMVAKKAEDRQQSMAEVIAELEAVLGISSARPAARASEEPSSTAFAQSLAFLQEDAPRGTLTRQKPSTTDRRTQTQLAPEHETGSNILGKALGTVAKVRRKPLVLLGLVGGLVLLLVTVVAIMLRATNSPRPLAGEGPGVRAVDPAPPLAIAPFDAQQARKHQEAWARYLGFPVEITNSIGMKLVLIPPGEFTMGSSPEEIAFEVEEGKKLKLRQAELGEFRNEGPRHRVRISRPFYLAECPVTQDEYEKVMGVNPSDFAAHPIDPSSFKPPLNKEAIQWRRDCIAKVAGRDTRRHPVEMVTWDEAAEFCRRLSQTPAEQAARRVFRLPTEAEWEYACRAGSTTRWYGANDEAELAQYAWFKDPGDVMTHPVGRKKPNAWGLFDMHGAVRQWCADWFGEDYFAQSPATDPGGPPAGRNRVVRGGDWLCFRYYARCAFRGSRGIDYRGATDGLRVVCEIAPRMEAAEAIAPSPGAPAPAIAPFDAAKAKEHQKAWGKHLGVPVEITNSIGMKLVLIPPGEFMMGSPKELIEEELKRADIAQRYKELLPSEGPQHRVRITRPFYLGKYEVTQEEWEAVMGKGSNPSQVNGPKNPVETVSWENCQIFLKKLSEKSGRAEGSYHLPTEAQWEYACRAGSTGAWCFGDNEIELGDYAWCEKNSGQGVHSVGGKKANTWGLCDMYGNVWEWCADWYDKDYYSKSSRNDPVGSQGGSCRVIRGGTWRGPADECRSASRKGEVPGTTHDLIGFRVSLVLPETADGRKTVPSTEFSVPSAQPPAPIPNPQSAIPPPAIAPLDEKKAQKDNIPVNPTLSAKPPEEAIVLFDGKPEQIRDNWHARRSTDPGGWTVDQKGVATSNSRDITSKQEFGDCYLHAEFCLPLEGDGNSGVAMHGRYEIQILNSYGKQPDAQACGAFFNQTPPKVNASKPAGQWQTFDIFFRAPRFDTNGKVAENARATVYQNGILIHQDAELKGPTGIQYEQYKGEVPKGPILLQGDHGTAQFRNVWILPAKY
jgi:formylglycine-generating enzyme required for sulfatase activity